MKRTLLLVLLLAGCDPGPRQAGERCRVNVPGTTEGCCLDSTHLLVCDDAGVLREWECSDPLCMCMKGDNLIDYGC